MQGLPTGTVTFLFTDLAGSTRLWEDFPDAMQPALARHDEIVRDAAPEDLAVEIIAELDALIAAEAAAGADDEEHPAARP